MAVAMGRSKGGVLRGQPPSSVKKRLKMMFFGLAGVGKTMTALQFPKPYLIDTERGAENDEYVKRLEQVGGTYFACSDLDDIIEEVRTLATIQHPYKTLIIDPITVPYSNAVDDEARSLSDGKDKTGTEFGRHKIGPDRRMRLLMALLLKLDMNVILTSHAKTKWERVGGEVKEVGKTFDAYIKTDYLFDLVLQVSRTGKNLRAKVVKSRLKNFKFNEIFDFSYPSFAEKYGHEILEKDSESIGLVCNETLEALVAQIAMYRSKVGDQAAEDVHKKWLKYFRVGDLAEITEEQAKSCIDLLTTKLGVL